VQNANDPMAHTSAVHDIASMHARWRICIVRPPDSREPEQSFFRESMSISLDGINRHHASHSRRAR
jgi:hypothetical protein